MDVEDFLRDMDMEEYMTILQNNDVYTMDQLRYVAPCAFWPV